MSQSGYPGPMRDKNTICVSEYFLRTNGIDIPHDWLEDYQVGSSVVKVLRLLLWPSGEKTDYHDIFYVKYFEKYPHEA